MPTNYFSQNINTEVETSPNTPSTNYFSQSLIDEASQPTSYFSDPTIEEPIISSFDEDYANSWTNRFNIATDNMQSSLYKGLDLVADSLDETFPEASGNLKQYALEGIERNLQQISAKPQPTRSSSFSDRYGDIKGEFSEGDVLGGIKESLSLAKDLSAEALPSLAISGGALIGAFAAAPAIGAIPVVGGTAATLTTLVAPLIPGFLMGGGETYDEAQRKGATPEEAEKISLIAGGAIGLLDRLGAAAAIMPFIKSFGADTTIDILSKGFLAEGVKKKISEQAGKKVVDETIKSLNKEYVKKNIGKQALLIGGRAATTEAITEALQERVQIGAAGEAAGLGWTPEGEDITKRMIDAAAIGFVGGKMMGVGAGTLTGINNNNLAKRSEEDEKHITKLQELFEGKKNEDELAKAIIDYKEDNKTGLITQILGRSMTPLQSFGLRSKSGFEIVNKFENYFNNINADIGNFSQRIDESFNAIRRDIKLPLLMGSMSKRKNRELFDYLENNKRSTDEKVNQAGEVLRSVLGNVTQNQIKITDKSIEKAIKEGKNTLPELEEARRKNKITPENYNKLQNLFNTISQRFNQGLNDIQNEIYKSGITFQEKGYDRVEQDQGILETQMKESPEFKELRNTVLIPLKATGLIGELLGAGIDINFAENYLSRLYKFNNPLRARKARKIIAEQLDEDGNKLGEGRAGIIVDNVREHEGHHVPPAANVELDFDPNEENLTDIKEDIEKNRKIDDETFKKLDEAGLVETNVKRIIDRYLIQATQRKNIKLLKTFTESRLRKLKKEGGKGQINEDEKKQLEHVYKALQNRYKPIRFEGYKKFQRMFLTFQYMLTLPLAGLTALTEPIVVLSRVGPKDAIYGLTKASQNVLRQAARSIFPKLKKSETEQAFNSILQGYDGTLAERLGSIQGVDIARTVTDKFFRAILLTQITQLSRDIAFQAARRQIKEDIIIVTRQKITNSKPTKGFLDARRRLLQQGLNEQNLKLKNKKTIRGSEAVKWAEGDIQGVPPAIIRKSLSKFVDEVIMAPNAVNRPLWMSNPHLAMFAQLKGFMFTFGNTVGMRMWREVFKPLAKGRIPLGEATKYALAFLLIAAGSIGIRELKDQIRYGDEPSSWKDLEGFEVWRQALISSNIFGPGTIVDQALDAAEYGTSAPLVLAGPGAQYLGRLADAIGQYRGGNPKALAKIISESIPGISAVFPSKKPVIREGVTEILGGEE
jgi:hypothetical protein